MHDVLMITHRRPEFTRMSLGRLLEGADSETRIWIWQNGTDTRTVDLIKELSQHSSVYAVCLSRENVGLGAATNWFWQNSDGRLLSRVDDD